ncbi:MAG: sugar phosphate isomerase/epimerase [Clostridia bacterium]|nr:sugar phosphate isomerase/epimerase [Clostridia bacterium]
MQIGAQLYTVRDFCRTTEDFALSMRKVADIGYKTIQVSGTCPYDAEWLKDQLDSNGLRCVLTHNDQSRIIDETEALAAEHTLFGCDYVGIGGYGIGAGPEETCRKFVETYLPAIKKMKECGKYFMYHNHAQEFKRFNGKTMLEMLAEGVPAEYMGFTLDTYWVQVAGGDPAQWLENLAGRIPCIHLKDCDFERKMMVIGEGNINFDRVFEKAEAGGTEYLLVEQDDCYGEDPFECLRRSYEYLRSCGLE